MSELMDAVKLLEDAMNERAQLETRIECLENELFRLVQRRRASSMAEFPLREMRAGNAPEPGRPKGSRDKRPRKKVSLAFFDMTPEQQSKKKREWGRKGAAVKAANRAAKPNGAAAVAG